MKEFVIIALLLCSCGKSVSISDSLVDERSIEGIQRTNGSQSVNMPLDSAETSFLAAQRDLEKTKTKVDNGSFSKDSSSNETSSFGLWISIVILILLLIYLLYLWESKKREYNHVYNELEHLHKRNRELFEENKELRNKSEQLRKKLEQKEQQQEESLTQNTVSPQNVIEEKLSPVITFDMEKAPKRLFYAECDVSEQCFKRVSAKREKFSNYVIEEATGTFTLIDDEGLREHILMDFKNPHVQSACEINGFYEKNKRIKLESGKISQDENGKWRIVQRIKVDIE